MYITDTDRRGGWVGSDLLDPVLATHLTGGQYPTTTPVIIIVIVFIIIIIIIIIIS